MCTHQILPLDLSCGSGNKTVSVRHCVTTTLAAHQEANKVQVVYWVPSSTSVYMEQLAEICIPDAASTGRCFLRSASHGDLMVPWAREHQRMGNVVLPSPVLPAWNNLPPTLHASSTTLVQFLNKLKAVLFCSAYET